MALLLPPQPSSAAPPYPSISTIAVLACLCLAGKLGASGVRAHMNSSLPDAVCSGQLKSRRPHHSYHSCCLDVVPQASGRRPLKAAVSWQRSPLKRCKRRSNQLGACVMQASPFMLTSDSRPKATQSWQAGGKKLCSNGPVGSALPPHGCTGRAHQMNSSAELCGPAAAALPRAQLRRPLLP